ENPIKGFIPCDSINVLKSPIVGMSQERIIHMMERIGENPEIPEEYRYGEDIADLFLPAFPPHGFDRVVLEWLQSLAQTNPELWRKKIDSLARGWQDTSTDIVKGKYFHNKTYDTDLFSLQMQSVLVSTAIFRSLLESTAKNDHPFSS
ncbi:MAG TPA: hypothetical protein VF820_03380, partial [Patescibacteria group bacterium]